MTLDSSAFAGKAHYRISEHDYVQAMCLHFKEFRYGLLFMLIVGAALLVQRLFTSVEVRYGVFDGVVGAFGGFLLLSYFVSLWQARRHYRQYKAVQAEVRLELCEEGIRFSTPYSAGLNPWENMLKWRHNERHLLIYSAPGFFHVVPKSIAAQGFVLPALIDALTQHIGPPV